MIKICEALIENPILYEINNDKNIKLAEKYCWLLLNKFDKLNITALRDISKACENRKKITLFFENLLNEFPNYCPALVEYSQFLSTSKNDRINKLKKAEKLLTKAINITNKKDVDNINLSYKCIALYMKGFIKLHQMEKNKNAINKNIKLNNEARQLFIDAVNVDENNIYARINLAQFLAFKDNKNDDALIHLEYAYNNLKNDDPNLIANLIKVLAKKAIEKQQAKEINDDDIDDDDNDNNNNNIDIDMSLLKRAFKLCGDGLRKYNGHFGLIVARSSLQNIKKKYNLIQLDDGLNDNDIKNHQQQESGLLAPQTTYGMVSVSIANMNNIPLKNDTNNNDEKKDNDKNN